MLVQKVLGRNDKPSPDDLTSKREYYTKLFSKDKIEREPLSINYDGEEVDDSVPEEEEIKVALFKLQNRKAPGLTGITAEYMKMWYQLSHPEDKTLKLTKKLIKFGI